MIHSEHVKIYHGTFEERDSRSIIKSILSRHLEREVTDSEFQYGVNGKPTALKDAHFNISHTASIFVIAITKTCPVGVDIELLNRKVNVSKVFDLVFSDKEREKFMHLSDAYKQEAFVNLWTRKEAFVKAKGGGMSFPLKAFEVTFTIGEEPKVNNTDWSAMEAKDWTLMSFDLLGGIRGALAFRGKIASMKFIDCNKIE